MYVKLFIVNKIILNIMFHKPLPKKRSNGALGLSEPAELTNGSISVVSYQTDSHDHWNWMQKVTNMFLSVKLFHITSLIA